MKFSVVTLFPDLIEAYFSRGLIGQARTKGHLIIDTLNPRQFTEDAHHTVDDRAFGGSDGMVMKAEPLVKSVQHLRDQGIKRVAVLSPQGKIWNQTMAREWAAEEIPTALICGRYAGLDHRFVVTHADIEISIGDFILNGGEIVACAVIESVARLHPQVLGNQVSAAKDSFSEGRLECPQFTRPREVLGLPVPAPLLSGHHAQIEEFEHAVSEVRTRILRPDLLASVDPRCVHLILKLSDDEIRALGLSRHALEELLK